MESRWGLSLPLPGITPRRAEGACGPRRGARLHRPLERRDRRSRRLHPARPAPPLTPSGCGSGPASSASSSAAQPCWRMEAAALASAAPAGLVLGIGASSDRIVEGWNEIPFERPLAKVEETLGFLRTALAGERTETRFKLETPTRRAAADRARGAARQDVAAGGRARRRRLHQLPAARGTAANRRPTRRSPRAFRPALPLLLHPRRARAGRAAGADDVLLLHHRPGLRKVFYRWLGYGEQIDPMVEPGTRATARGRPRRRPGS